MLNNPAMSKEMKMEQFKTRTMRILRRNYSAVEENHSPKEENCLRSQMYLPKAKLRIDASRRFLRSIKMMILVLIVLEVGIVKVTAVHQPSISKNDVAPNKQDKEEKENHFVTLKSSNDNSDVLYPEKLPLPPRGLNPWVKFGNHVKESVNKDFGRPMRYGYQRKSQEQNDKNFNSYFIDDDIRIRHNAPERLNYHSSFERRKLLPNNGFNKDDSINIDEYRSKIQSSFEKHKEHIEIPDDKTEAYDEYDYEESDENKEVSFTGYGDMIFQEDENDNEVYNKDDNTEKEPTPKEVKDEKKNSQLPEQLLKQISFSGKPLQFLFPSNDREYPIRSKFTGHVRARFPPIEHPKPVHQPAQEQNDVSQSSESEENDDTDKVTEKTPVFLRGTFNPPIQLPNKDVDKSPQIEKLSSTSSEESSISEEKEKAIQQQDYQNYPLPSPYPPPHPFLFPPYPPPPPPSAFHHYSPQRPNGNPQRPQHLHYPQPYPYFYFGYPPPFYSGYPLPHYHLPYRYDSRENVRRVPYERLRNEEQIQPKPKSTRMFKCPGDGYYYREPISFFHCYGGDYSVQFCAPGSMNFERSYYTKIPDEKFTEKDFCSINMISYARPPPLLPPSPLSAVNHPYATPIAPPLIPAEAAPIGSPDSRDSYDNEEREKNSEERPQ